MLLSLMGNVYNSIGSWKTGISNLLVFLIDTFPQRHGTQIYALTCAITRWTCCSVCVCVCVCVCVLPSIACDRNENEHSLK